MKILNYFKKEYFFIDISKEIGYAENLYFILYNPYGQKIKLIRKEKIYKYRSTYKVIKTNLNIDKITKLAILPTYACNFNCEFCYSAQDRSKITLTEEAISAFLNETLSRKRAKNIWLSILGGGEPFIKPKILAHSIIEAKRIAAKRKINLSISITTNGSILDTNIINLCKKYNVSIGISFEVLEKFQNLQRQSYKQVCNTIDYILEKNIDLLIKPTITQHNVDAIPDIIDFLNKRFPLAKKIKLQPIDSNYIFQTKDSLRVFLNKFMENYFFSLPIAEKYGISLSYVNRDFFDRMRTHHCGMELCLTPEGKISACHKISSRKEILYEQFIYGEIDRNLKMNIKKDAYLNIFEKFTDNLKNCTLCYAKYHCAGGCTYRNCHYDSEKLNEFCEYTRTFLKKHLFHRLKKEIKNKYNVELSEFIQREYEK